MSQQLPPDPTRTVSPDGQWVWDGAQWVPNTVAVAAAPVLPKKRPLWRYGLVGCAGVALLFFIVAGIGALVGGNKTAVPTASRSPSPFTSPSQRTSPLPQATVPAPVAPPAFPPPADLTVRVTSSTYGHVAASTTAGATCTATATLPSGRTSTDAGLQVSATAGKNGVVAWNYRTTTNTGKGTGTHTVSCQFNGQSASATSNFTV